MKMSYYRLMGRGPARHSVLDGMAQHENRPVGRALGRRLGTKPVDARPARHDGL